MFFKKEIYVGTSLDKLNKIKSILTDNNIKYHTKVVASDDGYMISPAFGGTRRARGSYGEKFELSKTYYLYVKPNDFEEATYLISRS